MVRGILDEAWNWFKERVGEIVGTIVDAVLTFIDKIVGAIDGALEVLWRNLAKPVLQTIFPILWRILGFPGEVLEFVFGKMLDLFRFLYGHVSVLVHEVEVKIFDITVSAVRMVYDAVVSMFVNVYNAVRSLYVGVRDVTTGFILGTVRRIRERLHTIITVDLWILGCWKAFQGSLESFSFGDFLKTAVLCMVAPVASGYIAGIITSLTPTPGTEFPGFIPPLDFPEIRVEDMPGFSVVAPPPVSFPTVGVSTLPYVLVMDLSVSYEVGGFFGLSDSVDLVLGDDWGYVLSVLLDFGDVVDLVLSDGWGYGLAGLFDLSDSVDLGLVDGWGWSVGFYFDLSDSVGLGLVDGWSMVGDEVLLGVSVGVDVVYPAFVDVFDVDFVSDSVGVSYPAIVDVFGVDLVLVSVGVEYPSYVDVIDVDLAPYIVDVGYPFYVDVVDINLAPYVLNVEYPGIVDTVVLRFEPDFISHDVSVNYPAIVDTVDIVLGVSVSVG